MYRSTQLISRILDKKIFCKHREATCQHDISLELHTLIPSIPVILNLFIYLHNKINTFVIHAVVLQNSSSRCLLTLATLPAVNYKDALQISEGDLYDSPTSIKLDMKYYM